MSISRDSIAFKELEQTAFSIIGDLSSLVISPAPDHNAIIQSDILHISAMLPELGQPPKLPPQGPGGPGGGQYIELLIDDEPTSGRVTSTLPHDLFFSQKPGVPHLALGTHMLHFILSSGDGLCVKDPGYAVSKVVHVMHKTSPSLSAAGPMLIYNLPRVVHYLDDVTLDFALVNVDIDLPSPTGRRRIKDYQVRVCINGDEMANLDYYHPYRILGLPPDDYEICLELVDRNTGMPLPVTEPYSRTKPRAFQVRPDLPPAP